MVARPLATLPGLAGDVKHFSTTPDQHLITVGALILPSYCHIVAANLRRGWLSFFIDRGQSGRFQLNCK